MAKRLQVVKIDRRKFERAFKEHDVTYTEASRRLGFSDGYIAGRYYIGSIYANTAVLLDQFYGIKREEIEYVAPEPEPEPVQHELVLKPDSALSDSDWAKLYRLMVEAFKEALQG